MILEMKNEYNDQRQNFVVLDKVPVPKPCDAVPCCKKIKFVF
jgi:hypothetical protein